MHPDVYKRPLLWVLIFLLAAFSIFYKPAPGKRDVSHFISKEEVPLIGRVESFPAHKKDSYNAIIKIISVGEQPATGRVYVRFKEKAPNWKDIVSFSGKLQHPYGVELPGNFDWRDYLAKKHIFAEIKSADFTLVKPALVFWKSIDTLRTSILHSFEKAFPPDLAAISGGILLGERGEMDSSLYTAFQDSGAIHLLVASGGNVGFVTLITLLVGFWVGLRRRPLLLLTLVTAGLYTLLAGADAPLVRAYLMAVGACTGYFLGRNSGVFQGLLLSCFVIVLFNPAAVFDTGFQMSFLATLAIIICLSNYTPPENWPRWVRFFAQIFLATLASQLALLPVFTNVFYKVSLTGLLSNMLLVPLASGMMAVSFLYYLFSLLHVGIIFYYPCLWGLTLFKFLVETFAAFQFSSIPVTAWNGGSVVAYYSLLFLFFHLPKKNFARKIALPCLLISLISFGVGVVYSHTSRAYLLSEWDHRAVILLVQKKAFVFNSGLPGEKIQRSLAVLGIKTPAAVFPLAPEKKVDPQARYPFTDIWPGEEIHLGDIDVRAEWEIHQTKTGRLWTSFGYSGKKNEGISYCVTHKKKQLCIGAQARFIRLQNDLVVSGKTNQTVRVFW